MKEIKYTAFLDILGFKDLIEHNQLSEVEKLYDTFQKSLLFSFAASNPVHKFYSTDKSLPTIQETNLNSLVISDSIIIWTDNDSQGSFLELLLAVKYFMHFSMQSGFPLRGGISHGELLVQNGKYEKSPKFNSYATLLGSSITKAYILENKSDWSGCIIDEECVNYFNQKVKSESKDIADLSTFEEVDIITYYEAPMKAGPVRKYYTINWTHSFAQRLIKEDVEKAFRAHNKRTEDWAVQNKIRNTLRYLEDTKQKYEGIINNMKR